jgi:hypothetical protein
MRAALCQWVLASTQQPALGRPSLMTLIPTSLASMPAATVTVMNPSALSRYGSAGELLAWLPIVTGHAALHGEFNWHRITNTRATTTWPGRECSVQVSLRTLTRLPNRRLKGKNFKLFWEL